MKFLLVCLFAIMATAGQPTTVPLEQVRAPKSPVLQVLLAVEGKLQFAELGEGIVLKDGKLTAVPAAPAATITLSVSPVVLTRGADGFYPAIENALVWRNGLLQLPGQDYQFFAGRLVPNLIWSPDDTIVAAKITVVPAVSK